MAATNFTPIILYHTTTASAAPTAGNLNNGELAINITDGKLFYKDNGGTVQVIATKGTGTIGGSNTQVQYNSSGALAGSANFTFNGTTATINTLNLTNALGTAYGGTALTTYTQGDLVYASAANTLAKLGIGANTYILTSTGSVPQWSAPSAVTVATANNLAGGAAGSVPYQSGASTTTFLSIGSAGQVLTSSGSAPQWSNLSSLGVTSLSFGTTGLTPSTATQGAITVAGTLATTNGGTGLTSFTANGLVYATSTSALTTGSALTYVGENLTVTAGSTGGTTGFTASNSAALGYTALTLKNTGASGKTYEVGVGGNGTAGNYQNNLYIRDTSGNPILYLNTSGVNVVGNFTSTLDATIYGVTVGRGAGAIATNTAVGASALAANTTGAENTAVGSVAMASNTTGGLNFAGGRAALASNTTGSNNTAAGWGSLYSNTTASNNTAVGYQAGYSNTTGAANVAVGAAALYSNTTASHNAAVGYAALYNNTTGTENTAVGPDGVLFTNSTGSYNTAIGGQSLKSNTTGLNNTVSGYQAGYSNTVGGRNVAIGSLALYRNTTGISNTAVGSGEVGVLVGALGDNTTGSYNTAVGDGALRANTTASNNTAVGYQAGYSNTTATGQTLLGANAGRATTTGDYNTAIGLGALRVNTTGTGNTIVGCGAGDLLTGSYNTIIGPFVTGVAGAGDLMTTGSKNTLIGRFNGNQGGLDIRTANNYIVLSDGDGNPRGVFDSSGRFLVNQTSAAYQSPNGSIQYPSGAHLSSGGFGRFWVPGQSIGSAPYAGLYGLANTYNAYYSGGWKSLGGGTATAVTVDEGYFSVSVSNGVGASDAALTWTTVLNATKDATVALQGASPNAGTGITFPATQSASSNANTLDDYEEGDWTPSYTGTSGDPTVSYVTRTAKYVKIGKQVTAWCYVYISSTTGGGGNIYLSGLPFTCTGVQGGAFNNWTNNGWTTQAPQSGHIPTGQTYVMLVYYIATGTAQVPVANLANACELTLCMTYQTD